MPDCQIFSDGEIASFRKGGEILRSCLTHVAALVKPGISTAELDKEAEKFIRSHEGAEPGFMGYHGFPATLCTSVNEQCVHGLPSDQTVEDGDLVSIDCGVLLDGLYTDACVTVGVGSTSKEDQKLMNASNDALKKAISIIKAGVHVGDISSAIQKHVESQGFVIVKALTGHGLGTTLHQFPDVPNFGVAGSGPVLPAGTVIAVEPIVSAGSDSISGTGDGWTLVTRDRSRCVHFEHTILIQNDGCEVLA